MGEKLVYVAGSADAGPLDLGDSCLPQGEFIGRPQIKERAIFVGRSQETIGRRKDPGHRVHNLGTDLIAAGTNRRPKTCPDIGRVTVKSRHHAVNGRLANTGHHSTPPGVNHTDGATDRIVQEYRSAVGKGHHQRQARRCSQQPVSCLLHDGQTVPIDGRHAGAMHLDSANCQVWIHPQGGIEPTTVLSHCAGVIRHTRTQIEGGKRSAAHSAQAAEYAMQNRFG